MTKFLLSFVVVVAAVFAWELRWGPDGGEPVGIAEPVAREDLAGLAATLERERRELDAERAEFRSEERRIGLERAEIEEQRREVEALLEGVEAAARVVGEDRGRTFAQVARVYEAMQPERAASILTALDLETSTEILRRMRGRSAARVMASLDPAAAVRISERMLQP